MDSNYVTLHASEVTGDWRSHMSPIPSEEDVAELLKDLTLEQLLQVFDKLLQLQSEDA